MRSIRILYRLFRLFALFYTLWRGTRTTRIIWLATTLWRMLRRQSVLLRPPKVAFTLVGSNHEELYRRRGWRKIERQTQVKR